MKFVKSAQTSVPVRWAILPEINEPGPSYPGFSRSHSPGVIFGPRRARWATICAAVRCSSMLPHGTCTGEYESNVTTHGEQL